MYQCKHCKRPVHDYTTKGINEWMQDAVVLMEDGTRLVGEFDNEKHTVGDRQVHEGGMWLHKVCWEAAGRPEFDAYENPSVRKDELAYGDEELWIVSPEVTDEAERERTLAEGIAAYKQRMFDEKSRKVDDWVEQDPEWETEQHRERPWEQRFQVYTYPKQDNTPVQIHDALDDTGGLYEDFDGTEEEAEAECKRRWGEWLLSDEFKALRARRKELEAQWEAKHMAELKEKGRFDVGYRQSKKGGDVMNGRQMGRTMFYVKDKLTYDTVTEFDFSDELVPKKYESDPEFDGNQSAEWEARVEEFRAETGRIRALADDACARLNAAWAEADYPGKDWVLPL